MENDNKDLEELVKRAEEDLKDENLKTSDTTEAESLEKSSKFQNTPSDFGDYFHERDRLDHNNIVDEVKTSFLEYSMSVI